VPNASAPLVRSLPLLSPASRARESAPARAFRIDLADRSVGRVWC
jgi:hypothetical protein